MPKMKTHKGLGKRVRVSARGKLKYKRPNAGHLMSGKNGNRCRRLRATAYVGGNIARRCQLALGVRRRDRGDESASCQCGESHE